MRHIALILLIFLLSTCRPLPKALLKISGKTMGTTYNIAYIEEGYAIQKTSIDSLLYAISEKSTSTYSKESTISKFNERQRLKTDDAHFQTVLDLSKALYKKTNSAFDPTVMPLVNAYGFGPEEAQVLEQSQVDSILDFIGLEKIIKAEVGGENEVIIAKADPRVQLDFSAIAKGYAVDRVADFMKSHNINNFLVEIGGEVLASGKKSDGSSWNLGVDRPKENAARRVKAIVSIENQGVATSGNYRNFKIMDGQKVVHTINPSTGKPEISNLLSATILAPDCATADALATACMVMGLEKAKKMISADSEIEAYLIYSENEKLNTWQSEGIDLIELNAE